ncbi:MAG: IS110 family transposase, partial [Gammaproteobacteria bacterium]|nr:IS110 family transposase [Gammaproteobacteria bacterium]
DLAKNVFHIVCCNQAGKLVKKKQLRRSQVLSYFAQLPASLVGMEGCASAHYWGRELEKLGHEVRLIPAQHVKAYVQGNKNDYNDAQAIAEAVIRPRMRFIPLKTPAQQDMQALHRMREGQIRMRTALCNRLRGLLAEHGISLRQGIPTLRREIPKRLEDGENGLSGLFRTLLAQGWEQLQSLDKQITEYDTLLKTESQRDSRCEQLTAIPGMGPIVASAFVSYVGDGAGYRRGRDVSASIGLVPRQRSTGGKAQLLGISKRGDRYLRCLLIHGARSAVRAAAKKEDKLIRWINETRARRGMHKATVALANKMARMGWSMLYHGTAYQHA